MCLPDFEILTFTIPIFVSIYHHQYTNFVQKKYPILLKLAPFYHNMLKKHPMYVNWAPSSDMETPWSPYQNSQKYQTPKNAGTYTYTMSMWEFPPPMTVTSLSLWISHPPPHLLLHASGLLYIDKNNLLGGIVLWSSLSSSFIDSSQHGLTHSIRPILPCLYLFSFIITIIMICLIDLFIYFY